MHEIPSYLFDITTPIGFSAHTTASYWELIKRKHPEVSKLQKEMQNCLRSLDQIRQSKQDRAIYLFYRFLPPYHICVVVKRVNNMGFVVTCYLTDKIKEGDKVWPISE